MAMIEKLKNPPFMKHGTILSYSSVIILIHAQEQATSKQEEATATTKALASSS
jgi:hypothetical protein